ncbi:MAG: putative ABC transport system ATP-binding protein [Chloroflexi bacterium]|jgi:putative ABC transport system ATP-binding protein|nr:MAG: putative ABC transport system ATP-binding protein [Chloroflexota bacterium]
MTRTYGDWPIIETSDLNRVFTSPAGDVVAVRDVSLKILPGEFVALTGRSGSGKTTLINLIGGIDEPTGGRVMVAGNDLSLMSESDITNMRRGQIGYIFQSYGLLPLLSAYENIELPLRISGFRKGARRQRIEELLVLVGLSSRADHRPYELSGGEQQRIAIARALAPKPPLILADEPTGDLDSANGLAIGTLIKSLTKSEGITFVTATHDLSLASMADRSYEMVDGTLL